MIGGYLLKGISIGIIFGVPVGVVGANTVQRTLPRGFWADVIYASISIFGLKIISDFLFNIKKSFVL